MKPADRVNILASLANIRTFSSLKNPVYRLYFFGMLGQYASMNMQMVTGSLLIYRLTGSAALLGTLSLSHAVPMIIWSMFGGAIADRVQKRQILYLGLLFSACAESTACTTQYGDLKTEFYDLATTLRSQVPGLDVTS
jgi:hypothetical protein